MSSSPNFGWESAVTGDNAMLKSPSTFQWDGQFLQVQNVIDPANSTDVATKNYVDTTTISGILTTRGDLAVQNGVSGDVVRSPAGANNSLLIYDDTEDTGVTTSLDLVGLNDISQTGTHEVEFINKPAAASALVLEETIQMNTAGVVTIMQIGDVSPPHNIDDVELNLEALSNVSIFLKGDVNNVSPGDSTFISHTVHANKVFGGVNLNKDTNIMSFESADDSTTESSEGFQFKVGGSYAPTTNRPSPGTYTTALSIDNTGNIECPQNTFLFGNQTSDDTKTLSIQGKEDIMLWLEADTNNTGEGNLPTLLMTFDGNQNAMRLEISEASNSVELANFNEFGTKVNPINIKTGGTLVDNGPGVLPTLTPGSTEMTIMDGVTLKNGTTIDEFSIDGTLVGNSDDALPTEKAVKTYVDALFSTGTHLTEWSGNWAADRVGNCRYSKAGRTVTIRIPEIIFVGDGVTNTFIQNTTALPAALKAADNFDFTITSSDANVAVIARGHMDAAAGVIEIYADVAQSNFAITALNMGFYGIHITYISAP